MVFNKLRRNKTVTSQGEARGDWASFSQATPATTSSSSSKSNPPYPSSDRDSILAQPTYPNNTRTMSVLRKPVGSGDNQAFGSFEQQSQYQLHQGPRQQLYEPQQQAVLPSQQEQQFHGIQQQQERFYEENERIRFYEEQRRRIEEDRQRYANDERQRRFEVEKRQAQAQQQRDIEAQRQQLEAEAKRKEEEKKGRELAERVSQEERLKLERKTAEQNALKKRQNASKDNVRRLRELIRERYRLDVWIWKHNGVQKNDRPYVLEKCERADQIMDEIQCIVRAWDETDFGPEFWSVAKKIKEGLSKVEKQDGWVACPPWDPRRKEMGENGEKT